MGHKWECPGEKGITHCPCLKLNQKAKGSQGSALPSAKPPVSLPFQLYCEERNIFQLCHFKENLGEISLILQPPPVSPENLAPSRTQEEVSFCTSAWPGAGPRRISWFLGWGVNHQEIGKRPPHPCTCSHRPSLEGPSSPLLSGLATMKLHRKPVLSYLRGTGGRAPDQEGILLKKGTRNPSYQRRWFILRGNLLYYLEHQGDRSPLGLILLDNCRVEPRASTSGLYAFTILASSEGGRCYKLAAETKKDFDNWLQALVWAGWSQLWELLQPLQEQYQRVCQEAGVEPRSPPQEEIVLSLPCSPAPSGFPELHQRFGEEIQALARSRAARRQVDLTEFG